MKNFQAIQAMDQEQLQNFAEDFKGGVALKDDQDLTLESATPTGPDNAYPWLALEFSQDGVARAIIFVFLAKSGVRFEPCLMVRDGDKNAMIDMRQSFTSIELAIDYILSDQALRDLQAGAQDRSIQASAQARPIAENLLAADEPELTRIAQALVDDTQPQKGYEIVVDLVKPYDPDDGQPLRIAIGVERCGEKRPVGIADVFAWLCNTCDKIHIRYLASVGYFTGERYQTYSLDAEFDGLNDAIETIVRISEC